MKLILSYHQNNNNKFKCFENHLLCKRLRILLLTLIIFLDNNNFCNTLSHWHWEDVRFQYLLRNNNLSKIRNHLRQKLFGKSSKNLRKQEIRERKRRKMRANRADKGKEVGHALLRYCVLCIVAVYCVHCACIV